LGKADLSQGGKAEEYILQGIKIFDELELKAWSPTAYLFLGELYTDMGQREKALETLKKAEAAFSYKFFPSSKLPSICIAVE
ncbi:unnamed protein product, partial [marine sediment metagenome]